MSRSHYMRRACHTHVCAARSHASLATSQVAGPDQASECSARGLLPLWPRGRMARAWRSGRRRHGLHAPQLRCAQRRHGARYPPQGCVRTMAKRCKRALPGGLACTHSDCTLADMPWRIRHIQVHPRDKGKDCCVLHTAIDACPGPAPASSLEAYSTAGEVQLSLSASHGHAAHVCMYACTICMHVCMHHFRCTRQRADAHVAWMRNECAPRRRGP